MNTIPIVLASDENYAPQMYITILSALINKNPGTNYRFICFISEKFPAETEKEFLNLEKKFPNTKILFVLMKDAFKNVGVQIAHITTPAYYRLKMPEIIKDYNKALYLDVDTVVMGDLSELFNTDIDDYYIGGVKAAAYVNNSDNLDYYKKYGLNDLSQYINSGVTLWNLEKIRRDNLCEKLVKLADNNFSSIDQDVINIAFYGKIKFLDFKYNLMTKYKRDIFENREALDKIYGHEQIDEAITSPVIIHYVDYIKPWSKEDIWLKNCWEKVAEQSPLKCKVQILPKEKILNAVNHSSGQTVVFWGASLFLQEFIENTGLNCKNIIGIIDNNPQKQGQRLGCYTIFSPAELAELNPDLIIFTIKNKSTKIYPQVKKYISENFPHIKMLPNIFTNN